MFKEEKKRISNLPEEETPFDCGCAESCCYCHEPSSESSKAPSVSQNDSSLKNSKDKAKTVYSYYSNILKQPFDSIKELEEAENEYRKKEEEKLVKSNNRKSDALKVEEAFKTMNKVNKEGSEKKKELYKNLNKVISEVTDAYKKETVKVNKEIEEARAAYEKALSEFISKHPEGYHLTLKDGDLTKVYSSSVDTTRYSAFDLLFDELFSLDGFNSFFSKRK